MVKIKKKVLWIPFGNKRPLISSLYNICRWNKNRNSNEERCMKIKLLHCACVTEIIHHGVSAMFLDHRAVGTTGSRGAITPPDFSLNLSQTFPFKKPWIIVLATPPRFFKLPSVLYRQIHQRNYKEISVSQKKRYIAKVLSFTTNSLIKNQTSLLRSQSIG